MLIAVSGFGMMLRQKEIAAGIGFNYRPNSHLKDPLLDQKYFVYSDKWGSLQGLLIIWELKKNNSGGIRKQEAGIRI